MGVFELNGRTALVTGGARGLGAAVAEAFGVAGAAVMIGDVQEETGRETVIAVEKHGVQAGFVSMDVTRDADWQAATARTVSELGGFDILVNNAGLELTSLMIDADPDDLRRVLDVNVVGTALGIKHAFRAMRPGGVAGHGGVIVNISSVLATIASPGISGYSASKSAVDRLTRVAAAESEAHGYGVRVNCIYPGVIPAELTGPASLATGGTRPPRRLGDLADMADAVVFFASDVSRFGSGQSPAPEKDGR